MNIKRNVKSAILYFSKVELAILFSSLTLIIVSFCIFDRSNYLNMIASLIGAISLIFCAKGNPISQVLIIIFSSLYAYISYKFAYFGEMITYLFMTLPMAVFSLISWLKNPYKGNKSQVTIKKITKKEIVLGIILAVVLTVVFHFVLRYFNTKNLLISTISITTSFIASYFTFRRSEYFALCYAVNDIVLIVLWILATITDIEYLSIVICFAVFFANDIYTFINWRKIKKRQAKK